ncbi:MAG: peptidylprolyl isomerase [Peptostreptococcaceae bacterium]|nr:peptidylprolyl isomerase [Peptostreptococcaceae bacterium]
MKKFSVFMAMLLISTTLGTTFVSADNKNTVDHTKEVQTNQYRAHGGDRAEITEMLKALVKDIKDPEAYAKYIAKGADAKEIKAYFKDLAKYGEISLQAQNFERFYQVEGFDEFTSFRGILRFKYVIKRADGRSIEYIDLLGVAKLGKEATDWKVWKVFWRDPGIDVTDVRLIQLEKPKKGEEICVMTTDAGVIKFRLFPDKTPLTAKNFKELAEKGFYDDMMYSRVIKDFVIQIGDPDHPEKEEVSIYDGRFKDEFNRDLFNFRGALCMANEGPNTNTNVFYIVQNPKAKDDHLDLTSLPLNAEAKYKEIGGLPHLDNRYTVFGQIFEGLEVVDKIASQKTNEEDKPVKDPIKVLKIEFKKYEG